MNNPTIQIVGLLMYFDNKFFSRRLWLHKSYLTQSISSPLTTVLITNFTKNGENAMIIEILRRQTAIQHFNKANKCWNYTLRR